MTHATVESAESTQARLVPAEARQVPSWRALEREPKNYASRANYVKSGKSDTHLPMHATREKSD